jgi:hypothetical protein
VQKGGGPLKVACEREGFIPGSKLLYHEFQAATIGNVIAGGLIGVVVDAASGAISKYPDRVSIWLEPVKFSSDTERKQWMRARALEDDSFMQDQVAEVAPPKAAPAGSAPKDTGASRSLERSRTGEPPPSRVAALNPCKSGAERDCAAFQYDGIWKGEIEGFDAIFRVQDGKIFQTERDKGSTKLFIYGGIDEQGNFVNAGFDPRLPAIGKMYGGSKTLKGHISKGIFTGYPSSGTYSFRKIASLDGERIPSDASTSYRIAGDDVGAVNGATEKSSDSSEAKTVSASAASMSNAERVRALASQYDGVWVGELDGERTILRIESGRLITPDAWHRKGRSLGGEVRWDGRLVNAWFDRPDKHTDRYVHMDGTIWNGKAYSLNYSGTYQFRKRDE